MPRRRVVKAAPHGRRRKAVPRKKHHAPRKSALARTSVPMNREILNPVRRKLHVTVEKSLMNLTTMGGPGAGAGYPVHFTFDPSGGAYSVVTNNVTPVAIPAMPDWSNLTALFQFYKVNWVRLTFNYLTTESTSGDTVPVLTGRYNYDDNLVAASVTDAYLQQLEQVRRVTFTNDSRVATFKIYPHCLVPLWDGSLFSAAGYASKKQPWTRVTAPAALYGFIAHWNGFAIGQSCTVDITYNVSFKQGI